MSIDNSNLAKNNRVSARANYTRWLAQRFGSINLMTTQEGQDRVALRKIYVPIRLDDEDRDEQAIGLPNAVDNEQSLGTDARDIIAKQSITLVSGRPGSGKSTLTQALIHELCFQQKSEFRTQLIEHMHQSNQSLGIDKSKTMLPVPLILRNIQQALMQAENVDQLLDAWWHKADEEAQDKNRYGKYPLDIERLKHSIHPQGDNIPLLIIFDGIDEVGGTVQRQTIMAFAHQALQQGHRVVLTGRPTGFVDLQQDSQAKDELPLKLWYVQPFSWQEIKRFIEQIYRVSDEWKSLREQGIKQFDQALRDPQRNYLLNLARRPIFLTLMALVHINDTAMPHGRANLYERIIDLYLVRQTQHKRLTNTREGKPIPTWDEREVRRALGYLAWRSQVHSEENSEKNSEGNRTQYGEVERQVIWSKQDMQLELEQLLTEQQAAFQHIDVTAAADLLNYYLHPAGLLVEPAEQQIQFSHLSFQEYLCAEYLHGQCTSKGFQRFIPMVKIELLAHLDNPGWDEIALLFLTIHSAQGQQSQATAHFEILAELDITLFSQAKLLLTAYCGQELRFTDKQRLDWLPLILMAGLIHPDGKIAGKLQALAPVSPDFTDLLLTLLSADNIVDELSTRAKSALPEGFFEPSAIERWFAKTKDKGTWAHPVYSKSWKFDDDHGSYQNMTLSDLIKDGQNSAVFSLLDATQWLYNKADDDTEFVLSERADTALAAWIKSQSQSQSQLQWVMRYQNNIPRLSSTLCSLSVIGQHSPMISTQLNEQLPLDWMLMYRETMDTTDYAIDMLSLPSNTPGMAARRIRLFFVLIQIDNLADYLGRETNVTNLTVFTDSLMESLDGPQINTDKRRKSYRRTLHNLLNMHDEAWLSDSLVDIFEFILSKHTDFINMSILKTYAEKYFNASKIDRLFKTLPRMKFRANTPLYTAYVLLMSHCRARDWFEQLGNHELMTDNTDIDSTQPLPKSLGLFDPAGQPLQAQSRTAWLALEQWLNDEAAILAFAFPFPQGLTAPERAILTNDLQRLKQQVWSPQQIVGRTLADWDEAEALIMVDTQAYGRRLEVALQREDDGSDRKKKGGKKRQKK